MGRLLFAFILLLLPLVGTAGERTILFYGDSLTAGYGLDPGEAFPALIQEKIDAEGWNWKVVNSGLSGETSAAGLRRIDWVLRQPVDIFVLELGGNDGLRGLDPAMVESNLQGIIDRVRARYPDAQFVIAGMDVPRNMGPDYGRVFRAIFSRLASSNDAVLIPFLLEGVGGIPELNMSDGIHPTVEGHRIVAHNVWTHLRPLLEE